MTDQHRRDRIDVEGTYNLRDIGGLPVAAGGRTRSGVLYRSDALDALTPAGHRALASLGLHLVLDLRSDQEIELAPSAVDGLGLAVRTLSLLPAADPTQQAMNDYSLHTLYRLLVDARGPQLVEAVQTLSRADGPALVHCTAGKDRTGVVVALALEAVGVEREAVVADYAATQTHLAGEWAERMLAQVGAGWGVPEDAIVEIVTTSPAPVMAELLDHVDASYGGAVAYLRTHGLGQADLARLGERLVG